MQRYDEHISATWHALRKVASGQDTKYEKPAVTVDHGGVLPDRR
jgi:hypothetical protein